VDAGADVYLKDLFGLTPLESLEAEVERGLEDDDDVNAMREVLMVGEKQDLLVIPFVQACDLEGLRNCLGSTSAAGDQGVDVDVNVNVDARDKKTGMTALLVAVDQLTQDDTSGDHLRVLSDMIQLLLEKGSDANATPDKNLSDTDLTDTMAPMFIICKAISNEYARVNSASISMLGACLEDVATSLHSHGAKLSTSTVEIMHDAARRGNFGTIKFWIENLGIDPNTKGRQGLTPLHFAARSGKVDVVRLLLSYSSVDLSAVDDRGKTALEAAQANDKQDIVQLLQTRSD